MLEILAKYPQETNIRKGELLVILEPVFSQKLVQKHAFVT